MAEIHALILYVHQYTCVWIHMYIYIYIQKEREREKCRYIHIHKHCQHRLPGFGKYVNPCTTTCSITDSVSHYKQVVRIWGSAYSCTHSSDDVVKNRL